MVSSEAWALAARPRGPRDTAHMQLRLLPVQAVAAPQRAWVVPHAGGR